MVKHTHKIRQQQSTNCLSVFDHFMGLALKRLNLPLVVFMTLSIIYDGIFTQKYLMDLAIIECSYRECFC